MRISANPRPLLAVPAFMCIVLLETNPHVANAQSLTVVHSFQNVGGSPYAGLTEGPGGVFYGTTAGAGLWGHGSVFALTPDGSSGYVFSTLYSFTGGADGASPLGGLVLANDGNLYGTTDFAGVGSGGTAFRIDTSGNLTTLHQFEDYGDGFNPVANLIQASDGNLYGVTESGGGNGTYGTVYRMDLNGNETVIHAFGGGSGGAFPKGALLQGPTACSTGRPLRGVLGEETARSIKSTRRTNPSRRFTSSTARTVTTPRPHWSWVRMVTSTERLNMAAAAERSFAPTKRGFSSTSPRLVLPLPSSPPMTANSGRHREPQRRFPIHDGWRGHGTPHVQRPRRGQPAGSAHPGERRPALWNDGTGGPRLSRNGLSPRHERRLV